MSIATAERLLYTVSDLAAATGLSETTIRECIAGVSETYPPLIAKRVKKSRTPGQPDSKGPGRIYITRAQAEAWLAAFPDA